MLFLVLEIYYSANTFTCYYVILKAILKKQQNMYGSLLSNFLVDSINSSQNQTEKMGKSLKII